VVEPASAAKYRRARKLRERRPATTGLEVPRSLQAAYLEMDVKDMQYRVVSTKTISLDDYLPVFDLSALEEGNVVLVLVAPNGVHSPERLRAEATVNSVAKQGVVLNEYDGYFGLESIRGVLWTTKPEPDDLPPLTSDLPPGPGRLIEEMAEVMCRASRQLDCSRPQKPLDAQMDAIERTYWKAMAEAALGVLS
jgi:hypothetical protein